MSEQKKILSWLPSAVSLSNLFLGMVAMIWSFQSPYRAGLMLLLAFGCDLLESSLQQFGKGRSAFGGELEALIRLVSFGVAPALLIYQWSFRGWLFPGSHFDVGLLVAFIYIACVAIQAAQGNIKESVAHSGKVQIGFPAPTGAALLASVVLLQEEWKWSFLQQKFFTIPFLLLIAFLIVSQLRYQPYRSRERKVERAILFVLFGLSIALLMFEFPGTLFLAVPLSLYLLSGILSLLGLKKRPAESVESA